MATDSQQEQQHKEQDITHVIAAAAEGGEASSKSNPFTSLPMKGPLARFQQGKGYVL